MTDTLKLVPIEDKDTQSNQRGRPRNLDILQQLAHDICYEPTDLGTDPVAKSRLEVLLREWFTSNDFRKQKAVIELAFGKPSRAQSTKKKTKPTIIEWPE